MSSFILILLLLLAGYVIGMLVNYLADVLPVRRRPGRPVCMGCLSDRNWREFLTFQPCESCGRKASLRYYLLPLVFIGLAVYFNYFPGQRLGLWSVLLLLAYFAIVLVNDLEYRVVLFQVSIAGLVLGAIYGYFLHGILPTLIGGAVGFAIMYVLYLGGSWFTHYLSKKRGEEVEVALGFGDVAISAVVGLILGWPAVTGGLMIGILAGGVGSALFLLGTLILKRYKPLSALPYTPFLILGAVVLLFAKG